MTIVRRVLVHGRVQGVWFRGWTVDTAIALGVRGWVRNRRDGSVELLVAGDQEQVQRMIEQVHIGPPAARVDRVEVEETDDAAPGGFEQRATV